MEKSEPEYTPGIDVEDMVSRCQICDEPFRVVFVDGRVVDYHDHTRIVTRPIFAHKRCMEEVPGESQNQD